MENREREKEDLYQPEEEEISTFFSLKKNRKEKREREIYIM